MNLILYLFRDIPDLYIFNSQAGKKSRSLPVSQNKIKVVQNGLDSLKFQPSNEIRGQMRQTLGLSDEVVLIGILGNFSYYKDHKTFINAAHIVKKANKNVHFLSIGYYDTPFGKEAVDLVKAMGMSSCFTFLGVRQDAEKILPAVDIGCLSSNTAEGFPNSIGEFMLCEVPCVVTDVGDAALIVGDTGLVVPKSDPGLLAQALLTLAGSSSQRAAMGQRARLKIIQQFSSSRMINSTQEVFEGLAI